MDYDWLDLENSKEHRRYALCRLQELTDEVYKLKQRNIDFERQVRHIASLEQQLSILQKTLDVLSEFGLRLPIIQKEGSDDLSQSEECLQKPS